MVLLLLLLLLHVHSPHAVFTYRWRRSTEYWRRQWQLSHRQSQQERRRQRQCHIHNKNRFHYLVSDTLPFNRAFLCGKRIRWLTEPKWKLTTDGWVKNRCVYLLGLWWGRWEYFFFTFICYLVCVMNLAMAAVPCWILSVVSAIIVIIYFI